MSFRKLRIAWSVFWGVAAVLLIVLWVRSYWCDDWFQAAITNICGVYSETGEGELYLEFPASPESNEWDHGSYRYPASGWDMSRAVFGFQFASDGEFRLPFWFNSLSTGMLAILPWVPWSKRFSLRTLLIATTLVATVLGLIIGVLRWPAG